MSAADDMTATGLCTDRHGIHESWDVDSHPASECAAIIEMAKTQVSFTDVFLSDEFGRMAKEVSDG